MISTEQQSFSQVEHDREAALLAYDMARAILTNNQYCLDGAEPQDSDQVPSPYRSDQQIQEAVTAAYGAGPRIEAALQSAHKTHYKELLRRN